jgi:hypothetical protein
MGKVIQSEVGVSSWSVVGCKKEVAVHGWQQGISTVSSHYLVITSETEQQTEDFVCAVVVVI